MIINWSWSSSCSVTVLFQIAYYRLFHTTNIVHFRQPLAYRVSQNRLPTEFWGQGDVGRLIFWTNLDYPGHIGPFGPFWATFDHFGPPCPKNLVSLQSSQFFLATFWDTLYTKVYTPMMINITCLLKAELFPWDPCNAQNRLLKCRQSMYRWKFTSDKVASGGQFVFSAIRLSARPLPICPMKTDWTCREDRNQGVEFGSKMRFFSFLYFYQPYGKSSLRY